ncbi:hypothetical protein FBU30_000796, partial [Linnemannia zychae]
MTKSVTPEDDNVLESLTQALRPINKNTRPNDIAPASPDEIIYVDCQIDPISKKSVVLWDDILQAFKDAEQVRYKARLQPKRIAAIPDAVLDVVVSNPIDNVTTALSQVSVTKTMTRRNPVFGSEEQAMENLTHMDMPNATPTVSSSAEVAVLNEMSLEPKIIIASQGDKKAQVALEDIYKDLGGVEKDYNKAMERYLKAAEQGDSIAQNYIAY